MLASKMDKLTGSINSGSGYDYEGRNQNFVVKRKDLHFFLGTLKSFYVDFGFDYDHEYKFERIKK